MNRGLDIATGELFAILESDDFRQSIMCEMLYNTAITYNGDIIRSDYFDLSLEQNGSTIG